MLVQQKYKLLLITKLSVQENVKLEHEAWAYLSFSSV